jgi:putative ATP-binding cassette transporter
MHKLNLKLLKRTFRLAKPYWRSEDKGTARRLLLMLILLLVGDTVSSVLFNQQSGEFTSALAARDGPRFWRSIREFMALLVIAVPIYAYYYYVRDTLALKWRRWMTDSFLDRYFKNRGYYRLLSQPEVDNPDQRLSDDINSFTQQSLGFLLVFATGLFQLLGFGRVLWSISTTLTLFLILYAAVATGLTFGIFGEKMVFLHYLQRRKEADFRFGLVRIRENAESIALYHGERLEKSQVHRLFERLFANGRDIIRWSLKLNFCFYSNSFLTMVLPTLIIAPRVLSGELEVGRIVQATGAFTAILEALTLLLGNLDDLSRFAASVGRLEGFAYALSPETAPKPPKAPRLFRRRKAQVAAGHNGTPAAPDKALPTTKIVTQESPDLSFENVTLRTPNNEHTLVKSLTVAAPPGQSLMIVGASGLGKSSLLRAVAGLWDAGEGIVKRPSDDDMLFLPQHAYMVLGSLRVQLNYPNLGRSVEDEELRNVLELVNLRDLVERCGGFDNDFDFEKILSVGERQRLAFARVFLKHPRYVLLDEATSALDRDNESALYGKLVETSTTMVSVSHHPALVRYHAQVLEFTVDGGWNLHSANDFRFTEAMV